MNNSTKVLFLTMAVLYIISPIDGCPGPLDDIIVMILTYIVNRS